MKIRLGIIGTGNIFPAYWRTLKRSRLFDIVGIAGAQPDSTQARAAECGVQAMSVAELLSSDAEIILNLTPPLAHHAVGLAVLQAGKHLFAEKPLAASLAQGRELLALARRKQLRIGCAPDTFLGAAAQATRALVDSGSVGRIRHGTAHFMCHGPDHWHPHPDFFYQAGAGPLFDVGVYYLTHLVHSLGPVAQVSGTAQITEPLRTIALGNNRGKQIRVEVPTHVCTQLRFASGARIDMTTSFDVWKHGHKPMELYGEDGSILCHDPNTFGGTVRYAKQLDTWKPVENKRPYRTNVRGIGLIDMALALREGRAHRCSEALALHVLEVMESAIEAARSGRAGRIASTCERPEPLTGKLF